MTAMLPRWLLSTYDPKMESKYCYLSIIFNGSVVLMKTPFANTYFPNKSCNYVWSDSNVRSVFLSSLYSLLETRHIDVSKMFKGHNQSFVYLWLSQAKEYLLSLAPGATKVFGWQNSWLNTIGISILNFMTLFIGLESVNSEMSSIIFF